MMMDDELTVQDSSENIRVCIRFRPINAREKRLRQGRRADKSGKSGKKEDQQDDDQALMKIPWSWDRYTVKALFPITRGERSRQRTAERYGEAAAGTQQQQVHEPTEFHFDRVYGFEESTETLYNEVMQDLVVSAMEGKHCAAFAFGQTSTGKTYTMQGTSGGPGVIPRAVHDVFSYINQTTDREYLLRVSYIEVYNESINDLFEPASTNLKVYDDPKQGPKIPGLEEKIVVTPEQVFALISAGEAQRHVGSTDYNKQSSRSHTIFRLVIESKQKDEGANLSSARVATLNLVDLAGSESAQSIQTATRRLEGSNINKSLLTLTHIIYKLSEQAKKRDNGSSVGNVHIPYRDSKLTRILQQSLQGNSRISIVCTATPWQGAQEETLNTLRFASRAKRVKRAVHVNEVLDDRALLLKYKQEIALLRQKLADAEERSKEILAQAATVPIMPQQQSSQQEQHDERDERLRQQIDEAIRNLNRVILNSGLQLLSNDDLPQGGGGGEEEEDDDDDEEEEEELNGDDKKATPVPKLDVKDQTVQTVLAGSAPSTPVSSFKIAKPDTSTPFFRKLSRVDHQLELHQQPLSPRRGMQRSHSIHHIESPKEASLAPEKTGPREDLLRKVGGSARHMRAFSADELLLDEKQPQQQQEPQPLEVTPPKPGQSSTKLRVATDGGTITSTPAARGGASITHELRSIREQLSSLLKETDGSGSLLSPQTTSPSSGVSDIMAFKSPGSDKETIEYIRALETRVEELEHQVKRHDLEQSVSKADRSFLEKLLADKDKTIQEWSLVIDEIETKQTALEQENNFLRIELEKLQQRQ